MAKNIVAAGLADKCEVQLAYAIGVAQPVSIHVDTFGTARIDEARIEDLIRDHFDLRPKGIIADARPAAPDLPRRPRPTATSAASEPEFTWERTDKADTLRAAAGSDPALMVVSSTPAPPSDLAPFGSLGQTTWVRRIDPAPGAGDFSRPCRACAAD